MDVLIATRKRRYSGYILEMFVIPTTTMHENCCQVRSIYKCSFTYRRVALETHLPSVVRTSCVVVSSHTCKQRVFFTEVESGRQRPISLPQHFLGGNVFKGCAKQVCACANQLKKL